MPEWFPQIEIFYSIFFTLICFFLFFLNIFVLLDAHLLSCFPHLLASDTNINPLTSKHLTSHCV